MYAAMSRGVAWSPIVIDSPPSTVVLAREPFATPASVISLSCSEEEADLFPWKKRATMRRLKQLSVSPTTPPHQRQAFCSLATPHASDSTQYLTEVYLETPMVENRVQEPLYLATMCEIEDIPFDLSELRRPALAANKRVVASAATIPILEGQNNAKRGERGKRTEKSEIVGDINTKRLDKQRKKLKEQEDRKAHADIQYVQRKKTRSDYVSETVVLLHEHLSETPQGQRFLQLLEQANIRTRLCRHISMNAIYFRHIHCTTKEPASPAIATSFMCLLRTFLITSWKDRQFGKLVFVECNQSRWQSMDCPPATLNSADGR
jgi:hypothetical protein